MARVTNITHNDFKKLSPPDRLKQNIQLKVHPGKKDRLIIWCLFFNRKIVTKKENPLQIVAG
jgi:hypothetical protein